MTRYANNNRVWTPLEEYQNGGWTYGPNTQVPYNNGEPIANTDVVFWYEGYLPHSADEGSTLWHSTGLRLAVNGGPSPPPPPSTQTFTSSDGGGGGCTLAQAGTSDALMPTLLLVTLGVLIWKVGVDLINLSLNSQPLYTEILGLFQGTSGNVNNATPTSFRHCVELLGLRQLPAFYRSPIFSSCLAVGAALGCVAALCAVQPLPWHRILSLAFLLAVVWQRLSKRSCSVMPARISVHREWAQRSLSG